MAGLALDVRSAVTAALAPWTVPYGTHARNLVVLLVLVESCVINGETVTGVLQQATWLIVAVIVLIIVRSFERALGVFVNGRAWGDRGAMGQPSMSRRV
ncbi:hypothetical protein [Streptomyces collinus]|uniref:hypothetical protein n=1 Tax=Streptomyces collinus TaxID=42684 RepID=UPI0036D18160